MELGGGAFGNLGAAVVRLIVQAASAVVMVLLAWKFLGVLFSGGSERAIRSLVVSLVVIGVSVAALGNLALVGGIVATVGRAILEAVAQAVQRCV
jgi:hypothetical protein